MYCGGKSLIGSVVNGSGVVGVELFRPVFQITGFGKVEEVDAVATQKYDSAANIADLKVRAVIDNAVSNYSIVEDGADFLVIFFFIAFFILCYSSCKTVRF